MKIRAIEDADIPAMTALFAASDESVSGRPSRLTEGDAREWLTHVDRAHGTWLLEEDGVPQAVGWSHRLPGSDVAFAAGAVHPRARGRGLGAKLIDLAEACPAAQGASRMHQFALGGDTAAAALLEARGYRAVRRFFTMAIELEERPEAPEMVIETVREDELRDFHAALDEAFTDHWEHHSLPFDEWWARHSARPGLDLSLWYVIRDGDELAAVSRNEGDRNGGGYVAAIGVRRPWRGQGYAKALLLHTFRELYDRGFTRVTLGVDAENPTGATKLYERVGMHVEQQNVLFERSL